LDSSLQTLFVKVHSDILVSRIGKQNEKLGDSLALILKVIADPLKGVNHGLILLNHKKNQN